MNLVFSCIGLKLDTISVNNPILHGFAYPSMFHIFPIVCLFAYSHRVQVEALVVERGPFLIGHESMLEAFHHLRGERKMCP